MSITTALNTGVTGLLNNSEAMNVIGNNISNVNTTGFKQSRMLFSDMLVTRIGNNSEIGRGSQIQKVDNIMSQGAFETTEVVSDLAIQGNSLFVLQDKADPTKTYYTRAGAFRFDSTGNMVNPDGHIALDENSAVINIPGITKVVSIDSLGTIKYLDSTNGSVVQTYGTKLGVAVFADPSSLYKAGGTLYEASPQSGAASVGAAGTAASAFTTERLFSNTLEQSNVDMATQFVKMIITQRAYSANSKTITTADEMTQEVLNLKR